MRENRASTQDRRNRSGASIHAWLPAHPEPPPGPRASTRVPAGEISVPRRSPPGRRADPAVSTSESQLGDFGESPDSAPASRIRSSQAEGVGFEPTVDLTAHNGFRDLAAPGKTPGNRLVVRAGGPSGGPKPGRNLSQIWPRAVTVGAASFQPALTAGALGSREHATPSRDEEHCPHSVLGFAHCGSLASAERLDRLTHDGVSNRPLGLGRAGHRPRVANEAQPMLSAIQATASPRLPKYPVG